MVLSLGVIGMAASIYAVYERVTNGEEVIHYRVKMATVQRLKASGFEFVPRTEVMKKKIYSEPGYEEVLIAFPRR